MHTPVLSLQERREGQLTVLGSGEEQGRFGPHAMVSLLHEA
jgi:hypothetical protein